ncbi:uncharacterized protein LOC121052944 [Rosa chinensis]|uniref:uncharacterized protein LOC121052944 n=1 Tax=Rosa chinensis TaxID=74649 RepID=UPI001AD8B974|nr:uncharacterized protein LOC121052944 [Rosa chinensis]XP_040375045.1 uncharacterized protein LOC121052944 [Rosa chinensis]XP_040375046.1 uncharacterized protein LOC121052944 [Rosa chinensis]XP_040375047.1 uncharacterized protein LOC121052944 [Rosa chinensis]
MQLCEVERMSVVPDSLGDLAQQEEETVSIQVQRIGSEEVDEPVLIQVKKEGSKEVDEAETMSEVPNSLAEQQLEPVPIQVKKEGSDKMDEAERLQQSKPESVMYIFCNEEPLWLSLCLNTLNGPLEYKGLWKKTVLHLEKVSYGRDEARLAENH